jgi:hypothetical protein
VADALISYEIVIGTFLFLAGLLLAIRHKYSKTRSVQNIAAEKSKIDWMGTRK